VATNMMMQIQHVGFIDRRNNDNTNIVSCTS